MTEKALKIATEYILQQGYDKIERAGERNGQEYFSFWLSRTAGQKLGKPLVIKISKSGKVTNVTRLDEIMWAIVESKKIKEGDRYI